MKLETNRLKIVPCNFEAISAVPAMNYVAGPHISRYFEQLREDPSLLGWGVWYVVEKESNTIIGDIGFKGKPEVAQTVEVGYGIVSSAQGYGYATEAVKAIVKWAFSTGKVNKIVAACHEDNISSIRVLEKLKMKKVALEDDMWKWELLKSNR
ncbi:ribosomal-protein-alanine N-acetyltransferase [Oceanobacillus limi]|uniref:Ribosomal-protein-alanine N-acetyltransferase n=1 Tax=Oceanobacillus limi TaxID=930131 RepID=A0A1H9YCZ5_9BACI|nr:GNAT family N-acetyltransferase [Oceanobacillus limi]SES66757.1 ribosomal-protein-alanine N-acetyltransferase [Oceanobacillus limi]